MTALTGKTSDFEDTAVGTLESAGIQGQIFFQELVIFGATKRQANEPASACPVKGEVAVAVRVTLRSVHDYFVSKLCYGGGLLRIRGLRVRFFRRVNRPFRIRIQRHIHVCERDLAVGGGLRSLVPGGIADEIRLRYLPFEIAAARVSRDGLQ